MSVYIHIPFCSHICSYCDFCKLFYEEKIVDNYLLALEKEIEKVDDKYLKTKLEDINLIYKEFENQIQNKYIEENDVLTILANNIEKTDLIKDSIIYIDEFSGFTSQEYDVLKELEKIEEDIKNYAK